MKKRMMLESGYKLKKSSQAVHFFLGKYMKGVMTMKQFSLILAVILLIGNVKATTIKLGTIAPPNSYWHEILVDMGEKWKQVSNGEVEVVVFAGGSAGDDRSMIRKMRLNQLDAVAMSAGSISRIYSGLDALAWPRQIRTTDEALFVLKETASFFNEQIEQEGFVAPILSFIGWTHIFSRNPVLNNGDLRNMKLRVDDAVVEEIKSWQKAKFNVVPLSASEIMMGLQSGMIDAYISSPAASAAFQWFGVASNMNSMRFAPIFAGVLISQRSWKKIPEKYHVSLLEVSQQVADELSQRALQVDTYALNIMEGFGLQIHFSDTEMEKDWDDILEKYFYYSLVEEEVIDPVAFKRIQEALISYRANNTTN